MFFILLDGIPFAVGQGWIPAAAVEDAWRFWPLLLIGFGILILLGGYFLLRTLAPDLDLGAFWPVVLIVIGIALLLGSLRPGRGEGG